jgi:hypothetical protein
VAVVRVHAQHALVRHTLCACVLEGATATHRTPAAAT